MDNDDLSFNIVSREAFALENLRRGVTLAILLLGLCLSSVALFAVPVGTYAFNWKDQAPDGTKIRVTATAFVPSDPWNPDKIDFTIDVSGLSSAQATNNINEQLMEQAGTTKLNGTNSINLYKIHGLNVTKVDGGGGGISLGGTVNTQSVLPGAEWVAFFSPNLDPTHGVTAGGILVFDVANEPSLSAYLATGTQPSDAAQTFYQTLVSAGYANVRLNGTEVSFFADGSNNPIDTVEDFSFSGGNLHLGLGLPATVPEPSSLLLLGSGLTAASGYLRKRLLTRS